MFRSLKNVIARLSKTARSRSSSPPRRRARLDLEMLEQRNLMSAGAFDPTFGNGGRTTIDFQNILGPSAKASAVAVQNDGKVVIAGTVASSSGVESFGVVRLNADGTPDQTFGQQGRTVFDFNNLFSSSNDEASAVAIDAQGRIVVAGTAFDTRSIDHQPAYFAVARLNANGNLDSTFNMITTRNSITWGRMTFGFKDVTSPTFWERGAAALGAVHYPERHEVEVAGHP
jgi:uncharacterized delta-60 repeat protein